MKLAPLYLLLALTLAFTACDDAPGTVDTGIDASVDATGPDLDVVNDLGADETTQDISTPDSALEIGAETTLDTEGPDTDLGVGSDATADANDAEGDMLDAVDVAPEVGADAAPEVAVDVADEVAVDVADEVAVDAADEVATDVTPEVGADIVADDGGPQAACPPQGPFGHGEGDTLTNYTLTTCDGQPYDVHQLCGANAGLVFNFYGW